MHVWPLGERKEEGKKEKNKPTRWRVKGLKDSTSKFDLITKRLRDAFCFGAVKGCVNYPRAWRDKVGPSWKKRGAPYMAAFLEQLSM